MNSTVVRVLKAIAGVALVLLLLMVISRWWGQYKQERDALPNTPATSTAPPQGEGSKPETPKTTPTSRTKPKTLLVLRPGVHFREEPSVSGNLIRDFKKGEVLTLLKTEGDWYNVKDKSGETGYVTSDSRYTKVRK